MILEEEQKSLAEQQSKVRAANKAEDEADKRDEALMKAEIEAEKKRWDEIEKQENP